MSKQPKKRHRSRSREEGKENQRLRRRQLAEIQKRIEIIEHRNRRYSRNRTPSPASTPPPRRISPGENRRGDRSDISSSDSNADREGSVADDGPNIVANWDIFSEESINTNSK